MRAHKFESLHGFSSQNCQFFCRCRIQSGDWMLAQTSFNRIQAIWPMVVDLFASAWIAKLPRFMSLLAQQGGWITALTIHWRALQGANPPELIPDKAFIVLVTLTWPRQASFPTLMELASDCYQLFHPILSLLTSPLGQCQPLTMDGSIRVIGWKLAGIACEVEAFRKTLSTLCWQQQELIHSRGDIDSLSASIAEFQKFVMEAFKVRKSFGTINILRAMLSFTLRLAPSLVRTRCRQAMVIKFLSGIYHSNP